MKPDALKSIAALRSMDTAAQAQFAAVLDEKEYADGQLVFAEGDSGDGMYFISQGCIRIEKRAHPTGAVQKTLAVLEAGDYFGEMALLDGKPRAAAAVASGSARVLRLSKAAFDRIHQSSSLAAMSVLFEMIRTSSERIRWLSTQLVAYDEVGKAMGDGRALQSLLDLILEQLAAASGADWGFLALHSEFSGRLDLRSQFHLALTTEQRVAISDGEGFLGPFLRNPQDLLAPNFSEHDVLKSCARLGFETTSLLLCPIVLAEQLLGVVALGGKDQNSFDLNTLNLVRGIARQAAQAILNSRYREEEEARARHSRPFVRETGQHREGE